MYFDAHVHYFPDFLAERAVGKLKETCQLETYSDGTYKNTLENMKTWDYIGALALHIATNPHQQDAVNKFAAETNTGKMLCFGSVHPDSPNAISDLEKIKAAGLYGIKLHPDYQEFYVDNKKMFDIYAKIAELGLPVAFHTGQDPYSPNDIHCTPKALALVADYFPNLKIIAAHMGGSYMPKDSAKYLTNKKNVWFDTAVMQEFLTPDTFYELTKLIGTEKVFFATDCPWSSMPLIREVIEASGLTDSEKEQIYYKNALDFFKLDLKNMV